MKTFYTKELLEPLVKESISLSEILRKLKPNSKIHGGSIDWLKKKLILFNIDFSHFLGRGWQKGKYIQRNKITKEKVQNLYLKENSNIISDRLKKYLIKYNFLENKCIICKNFGIWNDKVLILQIDHIDGVRTNNRLDNLRILCPNCHSQTHTYSGRKNGDMTER